MIIIGNAQESRKKKERLSAISDNNQKIQDAYNSGTITEEQKILLLEESNINWLYNAEKKIKLIADSNKQQDYILEKYGQEVGTKMINHQYWLGMTPEQLIDCKGKPDKIETQVLKTKTKTTYIFGNKSSGDVFVFEENKAVKILDR